MCWCRRMPTGCRRRTCRLSAQCDSVIGCDVVAVYCPCMRRAAPDGGVARAVLPPLVLLRTAVIVAAPLATGGCAAAVDAVELAICVQRQNSQDSISRVAWCDAGCRVEMVKDCRVTYRRRHSYNTKSNRVHVVKTPGTYSGGIAAALGQAARESRPQPRVLGCWAWQVAAWWRSTWARARRARSVATATTPSRAYVQQLCDTSSAVLPIRACCAHGSFCVP